MPKSYYRTTILIDKALWQKFRIACMKKGVSASELLATLIKKELDAKE